MKGFVKTRDRSNLPLYFICISCLAIISVLYAKQIDKEPSTGDVDDFQNSASVIFVIDHSGSMYDWNNNGAQISYPNDSMGHRFTVTQAIIDTFIHNPDRFPGIQCGIVVFASGLHYKIGTDAVFKEIVDDWPGFDGGYVPLLEVAKTYSEYNNRTGGEILREKLETEIKNKKWQLDFNDDDVIDTVIDARYRDLSAEKGSMGEGTEIHAGFRAAVDELKKSNNPRKNHFIIFISDGKHTGFIDDYISGILVKDTVEDTNTVKMYDTIATTFTIFFTASGQAPQSLVNMSNNIQNNGYSLSNMEHTQIWPFENSTQDALMKLLMEKIQEFIGDDKAPKLIPCASPAYERKPLLKWNKPPTGSNYTVQIDTTGSFNAPIITVPVVDTFYTPSIDLPVGTIYWRVKSDISYWSQTGSFIILDNRVPALIPYTPEITNNTTPTLKWRSVTNAASYTIQVDNNSDFSSPVLTLPVADTSHTPSTALPFGDIYWHVKSDLIDTWSVADHFFILADSIPFLLRFNGQKIPNPRPDFKWHPVTGATSYKILIADNSDFNNAITFPLTDTICILQTDLALGKWFWKVSSSRDLELYSPVDSLVIDVTGLIPEISQHTGQGIRFIQSHKDLRIILGGINSKNVIADIYNIKGRVVSTLTSNNNRHNALYWNFNDRQSMAVPSGMYVVRVKTTEKVYMQRVIVSK